MQTMTAKEYLNEYRDLGIRIRTLREELETIAAERNSTAVSYDGMPQSSGKISDKTGDLAVRMAVLDSMEKKLHQLNNEYWSKRHRIVQQISSLDDGVSSRILMLRYVNGHTWEQIAVDMGYSYTHTCRLHGTALQKFYAKFKDVIECYTD